MGKSKKRVKRYTTSVQAGLTKEDKKTLYKIKRETGKSYAELVRGALYAEYPNLGKV